MMHSTQRSKGLLALEWGIVGVGVILRLARFPAAIQIRLDTYNRYVAIVNHSFLEIVNFGHSIPTIVHDPYGLLLLQKLFITVFGKNEYVLSAPQLFFSLAALILFQKIKNQFVRPLAGVLALILFALSPPLLEYTTRVNAFESDVLVTLFLYILFKKMLRSSLKIKEIIIFGVLGAASVWCSLPAVFILGGIMSSLLTCAIVKKDWQRLGRYGGVAFFWFASFAFYYLYALQFMTRDKSAIFCWQDSLMPRTMNIIYLIGWFGQRLYAMFINPLILYPWIGIVLFSLGLMDFYRKDKTTSVMLALPFGLLMIATALGKYPFGDRALIFLVPGIYFLTARGWEFFFINEKKSYVPYAAILLLVLLLIKPVKVMPCYISRGLARPPMDIFLSEIKKDFRDGDMVYVHTPLAVQFLFYNVRHQLKEDHYMISKPARAIDFNSDMERLKKYKRVWFITDPIIGREMDYLLIIFNKIGRPVRTDARGYRCYLYAINPPGSE